MLARANPHHAIILILTGFLLASSGFAEPMQIRGWLVPKLDAAQPPLELGDDPIVGRQACPPLTRLNLSLAKSEDILLKRVEALSEGLEWRLELRRDIYWWSGKEVSGTDLANFLTQTLKDLVRTRSGAIWKTPEFTVQVDGPSKVRVLWKEAPVFGPYILNGAPFWQALAETKSESAAERQKRFAYECVGLYRAEPIEAGIRLVANSAYKLRRPLPELLLQNTSEPIKAGTASQGIDFLMAGKREKACSQMLDLPVATAIFWNTAKGPAANRDLRVLMTQMTPRGALLREGAGAYGELLSSLIPKDHPGYSRQVLVRPFDYAVAAQGLEKLGFKRRAIDGPRLNTEAQPLKLVIATQDYSSGMIEKVLTDSYVAMGIGVQFKPIPDTHTADGVLASVSLDWPRADLLATFHSRAQTSLFWPLHDKELDQVLERYALSLTNARPDFAALEAVHKRLFEIEPVTVIMQHKACVEFGKALVGARPAIKQSDPDWFRRLIL